MFAPDVRSSGESAVGDAPPGTTGVVGANAVGGVLEIIDSYALSHPISKGYTEQLRIAVNLFGKFLGRMPLVADLTDEAVSRFVLWMESEPHHGRPRKARTIRGRRATLLTLWKEAANLGLCGPPQRVRKVNVPDLLVEGFDAQQMQRLVSVADKLPGRFKDVELLPERAAWFGAFLRTYWDTGLRVGDLLSIERPDIWRDNGRGFLSLVQSKTQRAHRVYFQPATIAKIDALLEQHGSRLVFPLWGTRKALNIALRKLIDRAGLNGSSKYIRRGSSSEVERIMPGMGWRHLGHKGPGVFEKSYRVKRICDPEPVLPPSVG